jgi:hypothetical protein
MAILISMPRTTATRSMQSVFAFIIAMNSVVGFASGCDNRTQSEPSAAQNKPSVPATPFLLAIAADRAGITMAHSTSHDSELPNRDFYVLLSNVSKQPRIVWEDWNSWGYYSISFELTTNDGKKYVLSKRQAGFTKNYPSTVVIEPGEHVVYPIHLNEWWETRPSLSKVPELPITLKAIYEISPTPESAQYKVWTGRAESHTYNFTLRQW